MSVREFTFIQIGCSFCPAIFNGLAVSWDTHEHASEDAGLLASKQARKERWTNIEGDAWACPRCAKLLPKKKRNSK